MSIEVIEARIAALDPAPPVRSSNASADFEASLGDVRSADTAGAAQPEGTTAFDNGTRSSDAMAPLITHAAVAGGVDPALVFAIAANESGFNAGATSRTGAMGVMQLMPETAQSVGVTDAYDTAQNVAGGTAYLHQLLDRFAGNIPLAVAAYNAGPGAVERYGGIPPFAETQRYVAKVMASYARWHA